ncbi:TonB-dependent receptor [uncultured Wocania sp.]|uniref:SusC/RagA family TonB-linked outer membrane protein n=1 Tax=uncultured Wocania sp. TaxID=2834404 RepID=UPI0030F4D34D
MKIKLTNASFINRNRLLKTIMRTFIFLFCSFIFASIPNNVISQNSKIEIKEDKVLTVDEVFDLIMEQTDYKFFYEEGTFKGYPKVNIKKGTLKTSKLLRRSLSEGDFEVTLTSNNAILIKEKQKIDIFENKQEFEVSGVITDQSGQPLPGANILEKGTNNGTQTDFDGKFSLKVSSKDAILVVSYIGFSTQEVVIDNRATINLTLREDAAALDEVVVVGYGTSTKRSLISSVSQVDATELGNIPITNITQGLAGRSPGLVIKANGGGIGKRSQITIRGGQTPLVVIDGIIRSYDDFVNIMPDDIQDFSILKDASATAVYGSRAANGILQITTKKGKSKDSKPTFNYSANFNMATPHIFPEKLGSYDRAFHINEGQRFAGLSPIYSDEDLQKYRDQSDPWNFPDVDHQKAVLKDFAPEQKHNLSFSGGNELNSYYVSLGFIDQGSLYRSNSNWLKRTNFRLSQSSTIKSIGLKTTAQIDGYLEKKEHPFSSSASGYGQIFGHIQNKRPWEIIQNKNGLLYNVGDNPLQEISDDNGYLRNGDKMINALLGLEWELPWVEGLSLKTTGNYNYRVQDTKNWRQNAPVYDLEGTEPVPSPVKPQLYIGTGISHRYTMQHFIDYNTKFDDHSINALLGYEYSYGFGASNWLSRQNYNFPIDQIGAGPVDSSQNGGGESESGRAGLIGQLKYSYLNKYFLEGSFRRDGSDNFPEDNRWGLFFSTSLGWSVADEAFFKPLVEKNIFNTFKLRASYGEVGLDNWGDPGNPYYLGRFEYLPSYALNERAYVINGQIVPGFSEGGIPSPAITWFTSTQIDYGVDFSSLNNRLSGSVDYFYYETEGFLYAPSALDVGYTAPLGTGFPKISTDGEHRRAGWEFQLGWSDYVGDLKYEIGGNFTHFNQLWASDPTQSLDAIKNPYLRTVQQVGYWGTGYNSLGYYNGNNDIINSPKRNASFDLTRGDLKYEDFNGDGVLDGQDFQRIGSNQFPRANYGIYLNLDYKGFFFDCLLQGATSFDMYLGSVLRLNDAQSGSTPVYEFQTDYWTPDNTDAKFPRLAPNAGLNGNNNNVTSDFYLVDGQYIRLKDLKIGYDLTKWDWFNNNFEFFTKCQLVASGQNLFTISEAKKYGLDPENASTNNYAYPLERVLSLSFNIGF